MSTGNSKKQLTKNLIALTIVQFATYILPLISVPIVSRIIGPGKFGLINFSAAYVTYFTLLISYSFDFTATRKIAKDPDNEENRNIVFSEVFYTQCLLFTIASVLFLITLFIIPELKANKTVVIFSYLICISTLFTQNWLYQAMQDLSKVALFNLISKVLFTVLILLIIQEKEDYIWQPLLIGLIQIAISIWSFLWAMKKYNIHLQKQPLKRCLSVLWEERIVFSSLVFVNLYSYTNIVILGFYQTSEQVGYYTSAQRLITIAQSLLTMPLAQAFYPYVGKAFGESREQGVRVVQKLIPLILVFLGFATIVMFALGPLVIKMFYGQQFGPAVPVFQILAITPLIFALNNVLGVQIMLNLGMDKSFFRISASAAVLSLTLNLLLINRWGYIGTSINFLITEIFLFISMYVILNRNGLNPINPDYFRFAILRESLSPLKRKLFSSYRGKI